MLAHLELIVILDEEIKKVIVQGVDFILNTNKTAHIHVTSCVTTLGEFLNKKMGHF